MRLFNRLPSKPSKPRELLKQLLKTSTFLIIFQQTAFAAGPAFVCDGTPYVLFGTPSMLQKVESAPLAVSDIAPLSPSAYLNAIGYNIFDNYIYGLNPSTKEVHQIAADGTHISLGKPTGIGSSAGIPWPTSININTGVMNASGYWFVHDADYFYKVTIGNNPAAGTLTYERSPRSGEYTGNTSDLAFNPIDGNLYSMQGGIFIKFTPTGASSYVTVPGATWTKNAGGAWSTASGVLYFYANGDGLLYSVDMAQPTPVIATIGPVAKNGKFDATSCSPAALDKSVDKTEVATGEQFTFTFTLTNPFPTPLTVDFTDNLPPSFTFVPGSVSTSSLNGGTITTLDNDTLIISDIVIPSGLSPSNQVTFTVDVVAEVISKDTIPNQAFIEYGINKIYSDNPLTNDIGDGTAVTVYANDWGDAPISYGDAKHTIRSPNLYLGTTVPDGELQTQNTANGGTDGLGDDSNGVSDEDGVAIPNLTKGSTETLSVRVNQPIANEGYLQGWIDWNGNGNFNDAGEQIAVNLQSAATGSSTINTTFTVPADAIINSETFARFRWSSTANLDATAAATDGEVEDYALTIIENIVVIESSVISGRVFVDTNVDTINDISEQGIAGTVVVMIDIASGVCQSTKTTGSGDYTFLNVFDGNYEIYQAHGETTPVPQSCGTTLMKSPVGYQSTTPDIQTVEVVGLDISSLDFGEVAGTNSPISGNTGSGITFEPDHQGVVLPGNTTFYAHTFSTEADGTVNFTTSDSGNSSAGWSHNLYRDADCSGTLNGTEANTAITNMDFTVNAGSRVCIIDKVFSPSNTASQEQYEVNTKATFSFAGGILSDAMLEVTDLTLTGQTAAGHQVSPSRLELTKTVENLTQMTSETTTLNTAKPMEILRYHLYYRNSGSEPITDLHVRDAVPAYTQYIINSSACDTTPTFMTCTPNVNIEELTWDFTGTLPSGSAGKVSYEVIINN